MLTSLYQALIQHLAPLDIPLFLADCVPGDTHFPYITAEIAAPALPAEQGKLILTLWCLGGAANAERFRLTDELLTLLPARGIRLAMDSGAATLRMDGGPSCVRSKDALGVQLRWTLRCFPAE